MSEIDQFDPYTHMDPYTGLPPVQADDDFDDGFDGFDDEELEQIAAQGDRVVAAEVSFDVAQAQLGRRILPHEVDGLGPYIAEQNAKGVVDVRAAVDRFYEDNPQKKLNPKQLRREIMAAAIDQANPAREIEPPEELAAGATAEQRRAHRRARMAWQMEVANEQGEAA